ncbi:MFS transporter [Nocardioides sediminis]|uniref:MFS transporter n=1 Tax=Nocardioides sediminis TaxID=433648 RepID=UPI000D30EFD0|nr:MFS transporter [Nocardioides sediminis]
MTTHTALRTMKVRTTPAEDLDAAHSGPRPMEGRRRLLGLVLLVSAQFLVMLDASIVNVALPSIQSELGFGPAGVTWVVNAYVLAFAGLLLLTGRAADLFGRRRVFTAGGWLFTIGTLVAATAVSQQLLIAGRVVQGVGAAALSPAAMAMLLAAFPTGRARAMGAWGAASTLGGATGVMAGGLLAGTVGWRAIFVVTIPVSLSAVVLARHLLAEGAPGPRRRVDWAGAVAVTGAVIALVHGAVDAVDHPWTSPRVAGVLGLSVLLVAVFVLVERRVVDPLVPLGLFRSGALSSGVALALLGGSVRASTFVLVALHLQQVLTMSPEQAGIAMVPTSLAGFVVSLVVLPRVLGAVGPARSLVLGLVVLAVGHLWLAHAPADAYEIAVLPGLLLVATGVALSFTPTTMVVTAAAPATHTGLASGLAAAAMQVGAALGTAAFIVVGVSVGGGALDASGSSAAFTAAALVALSTALLGQRVARTTGGGA